MINVCNNKPQVGERRSSADRQVIRSTLLKVLTEQMHDEFRLMKNRSERWLTRVRRPMSINDAKREKEAGGESIIVNGGGER